MIDRDEAWGKVTRHLATDYLRKHLVATEACMRAVAARLGQDEGLWGLAGLVHDIDLDEVGGDMAVHGTRGAAILRDAGYPAEVVDAVLAHADKKEPATLLEKAICAVDPATGFIVAAALVRPDRKIEGLEAGSVVKRMKEKRFAANVDRDRMRSIEALGIPLGEFIGICLEAMKARARELGL
jgi:putative nucleotidyltransferase with HDIG domain